MSVPQAVAAQEPSDRSTYRENFDAGAASGWSLESGWAVQEGRLVGRDHRWARYDAGEWSDARLTFRFALLSLNGLLHANFLVGDPGRYYLGLGSEGRVLDRLYLKKQLGPGRFLDLAESEPLRILVTPARPLVVAVACDAGRIEVSIGGKTVLRYADRRPLMSGTVAFETLEDSFAVIDDVAVDGFRPARLTTPDLRGLTVAQAQRRHAGLKPLIVVAGEQHSPRPAGHIVDQQPAPESPLPGDRRIDVWLSQGPEPTPELVGMTLPAAQAQHPRLKIEVGGRDVSDRPADEIIEQKPGAGRPLPDDRRIEVRLSQGPEQTPQLVGLTHQAAQAQHPRLKIDVAGRDVSDRPADEIIEQKPGAGRPLPDDRRIQVWLSAGQPVAPVTPDLTGLSEAEARQRHPNIDLRHVDGLDAVSDAPAGRIVAQVPAAGAPLPEDRGVRIGLSLGPQRSWTDSLPEIAIVALVVGAILLVRRLFRGRPPREKPATSDRPLRVRPQADPGRQDIAGDGGVLTLPALRLRRRADPGIQEIDYPRDRPKE